MRHAQRGLRAARAGDASTLVGTSPTLRRLRNRVRRLAAFDEPVLVLGETGTGKELIARAIHDASPRSVESVQLVHCAGVGGDVLASELFGHARGAFTGAAGDRIGRIRAAEGSTLVLDEISETPDAFQAALLRAIEYGEVQPLGRDDSLLVDVRFVATSNRPLAELRDGEGMRRDLYHRLAAFIIVIPPLREHAEDIPELAEHFLARLADRYGDARHLTSAALARLERYGFPGNVRELKQIVTRCYVDGDAAALDAPDIERALRTGAEPESASEAPSRSLESVIRSHIRQTLGAAEGNLAQAARALEIPRSTLQHYLVKYHVEPQRKTERRRAAT